MIGGLLKYQTMKRPIIYVIIAIFALFIGVVSTWIYQVNYPRFQLVSLSSDDKSAIYNFQSSDGAKVFADDCIGCEGSGNITVYHNFTSPEQVQYLFQSNLIANSKEIVGRDAKLNERGQKVGERAVRVASSGSASIFWTEVDEFWSIQAPSLELAEEFESSDMLRSARSNNGMHPTAK